MMKKKYVLLVSGLLALSLAAGCGSKTGVTADTAKPEVQESQTAEETPAAQDSETAAATETQNPADVSSTETNAEVSGTDSGAEEKTLVGTMEEIKDFMFIVTDEAGTSYEFSFDTKPDGLDDVKAGDKVQVTYTGEISEVDPFEGTIISVVKG